MPTKLTKEELLAKAKKPAEDAMRLHPFYRGKVQIASKCSIRSVGDDFAVWYTPGVAAPCRAIQDDEDLAYEYTNKGNTVAVVSDSTRVQGLQVGIAERDIRAVAGLPLMEGKALLFKYLGGVDAVPICLDIKDPYGIVLACSLRLVTHSLRLVPTEEGSRSIPTTEEHRGTRCNRGGAPRYEVSSAGPLFLLPETRGNGIMYIVIA